MREIFRERDITRVAYFQSVLESEGIATHVRNQHLTASGLSEIPIPEFFPALCVINEDEYEMALEILRRNRRENEAGADTEIKCSSCSETNPGNFETCWSCGGDVSMAGSGKQD